jgi:hypothetical protein
VILRGFVDKRQNFYCTSLLSKRRKGINGRKAVGSFCGR